MNTRSEPGLAAPAPEVWVAWPVNWSGVWVGALAALVAAVVFGLIGVALGAQLVGPGQRLVDWHKASFWGAVWGVVSAFFAFVIGGWVAARIGGFTRSEPAMLHGSIAWLVAVPLLLVAAALGGAGYLGSWYSGLGGTPAWATPQPSAAAANAERGPDGLTAADREAAHVTRNAALGAITALLLGLIGSVLGGWMASGEPMTFTHHLHRERRGATVGNGLPADPSRVVTT